MIWGYGISSYKAINHEFLYSSSINVCQMPVKGGGYKTKSIFN